MANRECGKQYWNGHVDYTEKLVYVCPVPGVGTHIWRRKALPQRACSQFVGEADIYTKTYNTMQSMAEVTAYVLNPKGGPLALSEGSGDTSI